MTVSAASIITMGISCLFCLAAPVVLFIYFKKKNANVLPFFIGCAVFLVFALILETIMHRLVLGSPVGETIRNNTPLYALYGGLAAAVFEETGRFAAFQTVLRKQRDRDINALMYGAGHGGFEALVLVGLTMVSNIVLSILINTGGADVILASVPAEAGTELNTMFGQLAASTPADFLLGMLERGVAIVLHLSMSVFVWFSVKKCKWLLYPAAVFIHALADFMAVILAKALPLWSVELILCAFAVLAALLARVVWKKYARPSESTNG